MKNTMTFIVAAVGLIGLHGAERAIAQISVDGSADAGYGAALSIQNTNTQFGNANTGDPINGGGGSEINQVFSTVDNGRLYVMITGNLETNFNKLDVFLDVDSNTGLNTIDGPNLPTGVDSFCCGDGTDNALQNLNGLTFDAGFTADHYLTFANGFETVRPGTNEALTFYAFTSHYADLTQGSSGRFGALGMQLAHNGLPQVLRGTTGDTDTDGNVDGGEFLNFQRNFGQFDAATTFATRGDGDSTGDQLVDGADREVFQGTYGFNVANATFDADFFAPQSAGTDNSNILLGPTLPNLAQGALIDQNYAKSPTGGQGTDDEGSGLITRELEFALPTAPSDPTNAFSHRDMENIVGLEMAINNSNTAGVSGDSPYTTPTAGDPENVITGIEFSIPLSEIGNPTGDIRIAAFVNNGDHNYASNQFAGEGILDANLGGNGFGGSTPAGDLSGVNLNDFGGDQFVTVSQGVAATGAVPEPTSIMLMLVGMGCSLLRRRS